MVRLNNFVKLGLNVSAGLSTVEGRATAPSHNTVKARQGHLNGHAHGMRNVEVPAADLDGFYRSNKVARSAVVNQYDQTISVSAQTLNSILIELKQLETQVSEMLSAMSGATDSPTSSTPDSTPSSPLSGDSLSASSMPDGSTYTEADGPECSLDDEPATPDVTPLQVSGNSLRRRNSKCNTGSLAATKGNPDTGANLDNVGQVGDDSVLPTPMGLGDVPIASGSVEPDNVTGSPVLPTPEVKLEYEKVLFTSMETLEETTKVTMTRTMTHTETISRATATAAAKANFILSDSAPSPLEVDAPKETSEKPAPVEGDSAKVLPIPGKFRQFINSTSLTNTTANLAAVGAPPAPAAGKFRLIANETATQVPVQTRQPPLLPLSKFLKSPVNAGQRGSLKFIKAAAPNATHQSEAPTGFRTMVMSDNEE